jgi:hypothetical protein
MLRAADIPLEPAGIIKKIRSKIWNTAMISMVRQKKWWAKAKAA